MNPNKLLSYEEYKSQMLEYSQKYLQSNAHGMWDGSLKATMHRNLCELFIANRLNITVKQAMTLFVDEESLGSLLRKATLDLTDNLDEIGFPLEIAPNYKKLTPIFLSKFKKLANDYFDDCTYLFSDREFIEIVTRVVERKFSLAFIALESYGFEFVEGINSEKNVDCFLTMKSKLGQVVTVKPNMYFGCSFSIDKGIKNETC